jgi:hypothetical protein
LLLLKPKVLLAPERQRAEESTEVAMLTPWGGKTEREEPIAETAAALQKHNTQELQTCKSAKLSHNHDEFKPLRLK